MSAKFADFERSTVAAMNAERIEASSAIIKARDEELKALKAAKSQTERDLFQARKQISTLEKNHSELEEKIKSSTASPHSDLSNVRDESEFLALSDELKQRKSEYEALKLIFREDMDKVQKEKTEYEMASHKIIQELNHRCDTKISECSETKAKLESLEAELSSYKVKCDMLASDIHKQKLHHEASITPGSYAVAAASGKHTTESPSAKPIEDHTREKPSNTPNKDHTGEKPSRGSHDKPNVLVVGNSLTGNLDPRKLFAPLYTKVQTLGSGQKNLDGALNYLDKVDSEPENIVLHVLENNISSDSADSVINKLEKVVNKCNNKFPGAKVFVVEPIGRGDQSYTERVEAVRNGIKRVVDVNMIIKTDGLHHVSNALFDSDKVHLKNKGTAELCVAYKRAVLPALGISYVEPQLRDESDRQNHRRDTSFRDNRSSHRRNTHSIKQHGHSSSTMEAQFMHHMRAFFENSKY